MPELGRRLVRHRISARHRDEAQASAPQVLFRHASLIIGTLVREKS
jgi:hypothetical protein